MNKLTLLPLLFIFLTQLFVLNEQKDYSNTESLLEQLLIEFLNGASVNSFEIHNNFWADDLIYTSAAGERFGKSEIMAGLSTDETDSEPPSAMYSAEDLQIQVYDDMAIVAFRLVAEISDLGGETETMNFFNTGTFLNRGGEWRAVAWQATRIH